MLDQIAEGLLELAAGVEMRLGADQSDARVLPCLPAQMLAQTRNGAKAALLLHGAITMSEFSESWPAGVPVQIHAMENDEFYLEDAAAAAELVQVAGADLYLYPGDGHLFTDTSLEAYDAAATERVIDRILDHV